MKNVGLQSTFDKYESSLPGGLEINFPAGSKNGLLETVVESVPCLLMNILAV
jgi:hypothetical protein